MKANAHTTTARGRHPAGSEGFTLIEAIIALAVLTIGILTVNAMQLVSTRGNMNANDITMASTWAADEVERIFNLPYDDSLLNDKSGDGTNQDQNNNGIDDDDEGLVRDGKKNFGLDNATAATADGSTTSNDPAQRYTIYWNVAVNMPVQNVKTIQVIVTRQDGGTTKSVTIRHMKSLFM